MIPPGTLYENSFWKKLRVQMKNNNNLLRPLPTIIIIFRAQMCSQKMKTSGGIFTHAFWVVGDATNIRAIQISGYIYAGVQCHKSSKNNCDDICNAKCNGTIGQSIRRINFPQTPVDLLGRFKALSGDSEDKRGES